jgi:hypothetical protein
LGGQSHPPDGLHQQRRPAPLKGVDSWSEVVDSWIA